MDWTDLPGELLNLVLSKLFPKDRKTLGVVCKSWRAVANRFPWLMYYQRSERKWKFIQSNSNDVSNRDFPKLYGAEIRCSKYGCFFHPPTSPQCFIFGIADHDKSTNLPIGMLKQEEDKWTSYCYCSNKFPFLVSSCTPVLHRGFVYCLDMNGNIGTFDINGQFSRRSWVVYTKCLSPPRRRCTIKQHFLFKIYGKKKMIFVVFVEHDERKVNVFRLLEPEMKWESVEDLGDKMLWVSHSAAFAETAPKKSMANRIYFPMFHGDKGVFYSLNTRKYHSFEVDYTNINSYGLKEFRFATWYTPLPTLELAEQLTTWHP
ncbi:hypothetical protein BUALT_Bualt14G0127400 [Buddleja alternifolia]|uniref:F-box domain-containing protein n=1 Tax=Buddleja alternifolia TaxID=168488 RepID=A0AAV6WUB7_9LAMI|nr:hypothetical protein BUALT_Bualt14G0127400 [Buddleja alternifolia]